MKQKSNLTIFFLILLLSLFVSSSVFAIVFVRKQQDGTHLYRCGRKVLQGIAYIWVIGESKYRVFAPSYKGEIYAPSVLHAAKYGCNEMDCSKVGGKRCPIWKPKK